MNFKIDKNSNIQINEQIKIQLRYQIINGDLAEGTKLLSVREMASILGVNRHTVSKAYKDLENEGLIITKQSDGTYVANNIDLPSKKDLQSFISITKTVIKDVESIGFSTEELIEMIQALHFRQVVEEKNIKALFVECNIPAINQFVEDLKNELNIEVEGCLLSDIEKGERTKDILNEFDLIITTMGHYPYLKRIIKNCDKIYAINFGPYLQVINKIKVYPRNTSIGVICINEEGSTSLKQIIKNLDVVQGPIFSKSLENLDEIKELAKQADVLVVSKFALEANRIFFESLSNEIVEYENVLQMNSVEMLREVIDQIKQNEDK